MFPHRNFHKYTWTSPDGKTHNQIDHILRDKRWQSIILDERIFRGADSDSDHYLVVARVRERLSISKQEGKNFDGERFNLRKLSELDVRKQCQIKITNRLAALKSFSDGQDINRAWVNINDNIKTSTKDSPGLHELRQHKQWLGEECLGF